MNLSKAIENGSKKPLVAIFLLTLQLFLLTPITIYLGNITQLEYTLSSAASIFLFFFCTSTLLLYLLFKLCPTKVQLKLINITLALTLLTWIQANLLVWNYGVLNGQEIEWNTHTWQPWLEAAIWIGILICFIAFSSEKATTLQLKCVLFVIGIKGLSVGIEVVENIGRLPAHDPQFNQQDIITAGQFSKNRNVLHMVVDGFQSDIFYDLVHNENLHENNHENNLPTLKEHFSGFQFYLEALGVFPYTRFSLPAFLSAEIYANNEPKDAFSLRALKENSILTLAKENQFELDIATPGGFILNHYQAIEPDNLVQIDNAVIQKSKTQALSLWIDMSLFRSFPHLLKKRIYNQQQWLFSNLLEIEPALGETFFLHSLFLTELTKTLSATRNDHVYKYIHIHNTHNPMVTNPNCSYSGQADGMNRPRLLIQSRCTIPYLVSFLNKLKQSGLYDDMLIIIHGDHGGWVPNGQPGQNLAPLDTIFDDPRTHTLISGLASPLLLIKEPGAQGPLHTSHQWVSLKQLPKTVADIMGWENKYQEPSIQETANQKEYTRSFYFFPFQKNAYVEEYLDFIIKFRITGSHFSTAWQAEEVIYPPKQTPEKEKRKEI